MTTKTTKKRGRPAKKTTVDEPKVVDEFIAKAEADPLSYPPITEVRVYRLCRNPRFAMGVPCFDGKPDLSAELVSVECPKSLRDKLLGKTVKVANVGVGSEPHYVYLR